MTLYVALLGQAWNILGGFGGQFSFGHAVFFGTGAYAMAVLQVHFGLERLGSRCPPALALRRRGRRCWSARSRSATACAARTSRW